MYRPSEKKTNLVKCILTGGGQHSAGRERKAGRMSLQKSQTRLDNVLYYTISWQVKCIHYTQDYKMYCAMQCIDCRPYFTNCSGMHRWKDAADHFVTNLRFGVLLTSLNNAEAILNLCVFDSKNDQTSWYSMSVLVFSKSFQSVLFLFSCCSMFFFQLWCCAVSWQDAIKLRCIHFRLDLTMYVVLSDVLYHGVVMWNVSCLNMIV